MSSPILSVSLTLSVLISCRSPVAERVFYDSPPTWVTPLPEVRVAPDETWAIFGSGKWRKVVNLVTSREDDEFLSEIPAEGVARSSPDGSTVASYADETVTVGTLDYALDGAIRALEWNHDGSAVLALVTHDGGGSSIVSVQPSEGHVATLVRDLDAPLRGNTIGVAPEGAILYLALASAGSLDVDARHDPDADRDLALYEVDLGTGERKLIVDSPMDELSPKVAGKHLYWTRVEYRQSIVALPISGGDAHLVAEGGQIPYWRHDGRAIGYTVGLPLASDAPLNMDADVIDVDENARPVSEPRPIIRGFHEDFTPAWSPDGSWLAFHSHRSPTAVPAYHSEGSTDDLYLLGAAKSTEDEIRLTDFGWEMGMADWAPDGERLVAVTWEEGAPGIGIPYVVTIDPATGEARELERLGLPGTLRSARLVAWSPVADAIAIENDAGNERHSIWVLDLGTGGVDFVVDYACDTYGGLDWTPDGERIVYSALFEGSYQIFSVPRSGGEPTKLSRASGQLLQPQVSPDGRFIAATRIEATRELWRRTR